MFLFTIKNTTRELQFLKFDCKSIQQIFSWFELENEIITLRGIEIIMESLILAQNERWRRVLSMQVER